MLDPITYYSKPSSPTYPLIQPMSRLYGTKPNTPRNHSKNTHSEVQLLFKVHPLVNNPHHLKSISLKKLKRTHKLSPIPMNSNRGAGTYVLPGPSFEFPQTLRFPGKNFKFIQTLRSRRKQDNGIVKSNMNLAKYVPENMNEGLRVRTRVASEKVLKIRDNREKLRTERKVKFEEAMERKKMKEDFRVNRGAYLELARSWVTIYCLSGVVKELQGKCSKMKIIKEKRRKYVALLCICSRFTGKLKIIYKEIRTRKARHMLENLNFISKICEFTLRAKAIEKIAKVTEKSLCQDQLFQLHIKWYRNILFIQRTLRRLISMKKTGLKLRADLWFELESPLLGHTPDEVKIFYIKSTLMQRAKMYCAQMELFKHQPTKLKKTTAPLPYYFFSRGTYKSLIIQAKLDCPFI